jgi:uncharacterized protein (DUF697 family)
VKIRQAVLRKVMPDVHRMAPNLTSNFVHQTVHRAIHGVGPLPPAAAAAEKQLEEQDGVVEDAIGELIENHASLAAAQGFVTNLGGLMTMAATVPLNITGLALVQVRLVAGIAHLRGYDLNDDRVRNAILVCTLGEQTVKQLVKDKRIPGTPMVLATAPAYDPALDQLVAGEVTESLISRVIGKRTASAMARRVPVAGGVWAASTDGYATWQIGRYAERELRPRTEAAAVGTGRNRRSR